MYNTYSIPSFSLSLVTALPRRLQFPEWWHVMKVCKYSPCCKSIHHALSEYTVEISTGYIKIMDSLY